MKNRPGGDVSEVLQFDYDAFVEVVISSLKVVDVDTSSKAALTLPRKWYSNCGAIRRSYLDSMARWVGMRKGAPAAAQERPAVHLQVDGQQQNSFP